MRVALEAITLVRNHPAWNRGSQESLFADLTETRKQFKHFGRLPDANSHAHLFDETIQILDTLCELVVGQSLLSIDHASLISSIAIKSFFQSARDAINTGEYQLALEQTARGLSQAFWELNSPSHIVAGEASSEDALLLSGRGIDPASFLTMQRFLPRVGTADGDPIWNLREYGHSENWTEENARFCLETAIAAVVRLQSSPAYRSPLRFHDVFDDVITIVVPEPRVLWANGSPLSLDVPEREIKVFEVGDIIAGEATGRIRLPSSESTSEPVEADLNWAEWIELRYAKTSREGLPTIHEFSHHILWFKKDQVQISYQPNRLQMLLSLQAGTAID